MEELYERKIKEYKSAFFDLEKGGKITDFLMYRALEKDLQTLQLEHENELNL